MMDPFVRKLLERLHAEGQPLTRNRHFHTFETPEGKQALKISRRLKSLQRDVLASRAAGNPPRVTEHAGKDRDAEISIEISLATQRGRRTCRLTPEEFALLLLLPEMNGVLPSRSLHRY